MQVAPVGVLGAGMISGVGQTWEEGCAAIRCGMNNFQETLFRGGDGERLIGSAVRLTRPWRGILRLAKMAASALAECFEVADEAPERIPVLMCVAESERAGRFEGPQQVLLADVETELGFRLHPHSRVIEQGRVGGAVALLQARRMMTEGRSARVIVAGVDSYLNGATLAHYDAEHRLLTRSNSNGFVPGEAAAALLLGLAAQGGSVPLVLQGLGFGREPAPFGSGKPLRAEGLLRAMRGALEEAGMPLSACDHRIADVNGEQYRFREASLAIMRLLRDRKVLFGLWHTADCIGEVGAAAVPAMFAVLLAGARKDYLPGPSFVGHAGNDDDRRAAFVARATAPQTLALEAAAESSFGSKRRSSLH
jgi:3-oxoacyl-[acyl-carrier-protein] synthase I